MATSLTLAPALTHCSAAPRPRPPRGLPQPIRPTRMTSLPPAWTGGVLARRAAVPMAVAADVLRKSRRDAVPVGFGAKGSVMTWSPEGGVDERYRVRGCEKMATGSGHPANMQE